MPFQHGNAYAGAQLLDRLDEGVDAVERSRETVNDENAESLAAHVNSFAYCMRVWNDHS